jgi:lysophospholipase L1-like esterase
MPSILRFIVPVFMLAVHAASNGPTVDGAESFPLTAKRILFLGDSITAACEYVNMIEMQLRLQSNHPVPEIINIGLPSEGCTGLSEPAHPFPRPNVHERLERALAAVKPDVVVACYGMNDGIYFPFSESRFQQYQDGINLLIEKVHSSGAKLVLLTPPPFDALPLRDAGKLLPDGRDDYAWFAIYENYDQVIAKYGQWLMQQKDRVEMVVDLHTPITEFWNSQRKTNPKFTVAADGVHCDTNGHRSIAEVVLKAWGISSMVPVTPEMTELINQKGTVIHDSWLSHVGHKRPGVAPGLPPKEAELKAAEIDGRLTPLINSARK